MSNKERAAEIIEKHGFYPCCEPECLAQDLADAGLLAPDLPEPDGDDGVHHVYTAVDNLDVVSVTGHVQLNRLEPAGRTAVWDGKPAAARSFAHVLLAAANHAEGNRV